MSSNMLCSGRKNESLIYFSQFVGIFLLHVDHTIVTVNEGPLSGADLLGEGRQSQRATFFLTSSIRKTN